MARNKSGPPASERPEEAKGGTGKDAPMGTIAAAATRRAGGRLEFDPSESFFPPIPSLVEAMPPPENRTQPLRVPPVSWMTRHSREVLLAALLATVAGIAFIYFQIRRGPGPAVPLNVESRGTPSNSFAVGSIAGSATNPKPSGNEPSPLAPAGSAPAVRVTHTRQAAAATAAASGAEAATEPAKEAARDSAREPAPARRAAAPAPVERPPAQAPARPKQDPRVGECTEAVAALGLCERQ
jgi:hypothetical protein